MSCVRQRSAEKAVRDVKCQQLSTREEERERKKEGNEAGEGGGRVLSAAARLPTKPKFTFGEFGLWGAWLPQTARGRFCTMRDLSAAEISTLGGGHACAGLRHRARGRPSREGRAENMRARGARARQGTGAKKYNDSITTHLCISWPASLHSSRTPSSSVTISVPRPSPIAAGPLQAGPCPPR